MTALRPSEFDAHIYRDVPAHPRATDIGDVAGRVPLIPGAWMVAGLIFTCIAVTALMMRAGLGIERNAAAATYVVLAMLALSARLGLRRATSQRARFATDLLETFSLFSSISLLGALATYPLAIASSGFVDAGLQRIDGALGFDWMAWYGVVASRPWLQEIEQVAYLSLFVTPLLLLGFLAREGRRAEARMFIASFWLAALITMSLLPWLPAEGPLIYLGHGHIPYMPFSGLHEQQDILALRSGAIRDVNLGALHGLVSAPSFHAASGVMFILAGWRIRLLRWPVFVVAGAMLLATPVEGTHYLIDIIAGAAVALFATFAMPRLVRAGLSLGAARLALGEARRRIAAVPLPGAATVQLFVNPKAGTSSAARVRALRGAFEDAGARVILAESRDGELVVEAGVDHVCVVGGDGTLRHVTDAVRRAGRDDVTMSVYPAGTVNLLAMECDYSRDPRAFARRVLSGVDRRHHYAGLVGETPLLCCASVGPDSFAVASLSPELKRLIGRAAYGVAFVNLLWRWPRMRLTLTHDGQDMLCEAAYVAKGRYFAGRRSFAPDAGADQPVFHVIAIEKASRLRYLSLALALIAGRSLDRLPGVRSFTCEQLALSADNDDDAVPLQADGDIVAMLPASITLQREAMAFA